MATIEQDSFERPVALDEDSENQLNLRDLAAILNAGKWWIIGFVVLAGVIAEAHLYMAPPIYQANALLQVEQNQSSNAQFDQIQQMAQMVTGGSTPAETEIQILRSRSVVGQAVRKLGLNIHAKPLYFPYVGAAIARHASASSGPAQPWFGLKKYAWGGEQIKVTRLIVPNDLFDHTLTLVALGNGRYKLQTKKGRALLQGKVGSAAQSSDGKVKMFVEELKARPGEHFVVRKNHWLEAVDRLQSRLSVSEQGKDTGIIQMTLSGTDPLRIRHILNTIADTFLRQNVQRRSAQAQQSLSFIQKQLPQLRQQLNQAETKFANYRQKHQAVDLSNEGQTELNQLVNVEQNLEQLKLKRSQYAQLYTAKHPRVKALESQMATLRHKKQEIEGQINKLPQKEKDILELKRDVQVNTQIYTNLLNEAQQLKIVKAGTVGTVRIIDHAAVPGAPIAPERHRTLLVAILLGIIAGVGWLFLRRALFRGITDPRQIEERLGISVYSVIPHSTKLTRQERRAKRRGWPLPVLARVEPQDEAVEALRSLRTSLHFALLESERKTIMITGATPEVGKSFVTINLGMLVAASGQRVVVVDGDLRRGKLHEYLGEDRAPGLSDVLAETATLDAALRPSAQADLTIMPSGTLPPNPSELLMSSRFGQLMDGLEKRFDVVLVDTPPLMAVTDAAIVSPHAGANFLVVKAGVSSMPEVEESVKRLQQNRMRVHGILFNDFRPNAVAGSYSSYAYYYYKYESGYK